MKAIVITRPGGPEVLQVAGRPIPQPGPEEVLVRVRAAGLNRPDIAQRKGKYPAPAGAPADIPGLEIAGTVEATGAAVQRWQKGDRVCGLVSGGGYAEYCLIPAGQCLPLPGKLSLTEAASLPETYFTVWSNVFDRGKLQRGDNFLVHGGSGGIGITAIQLASAWECKVFTTAGTAEKCHFCQELGADKAINYQTTDFEEVIGSHPDGKAGIQVILDIIGGDYTPRNLRLLANDGRLVLINAMKGRESSVDLLEIMRRRLVITGSTLRARSVDFKSELARKVEENCWPLLASGSIRPVVHAVFPLEEAAGAHRLMESGKHRGKIVLEIS